MATAKPHKSKRALSHSVKGQTATIQAAVMPTLQPPAHVHLRDYDTPFWNSIINARAREFWTDADLENAANLARCKADIEKIQREIDAEGSIIVGGTVTKTTKTPKGNILTQTRKGADFINPRHQLLEQLTKRALAFSRILHVHAAATSGRTEDESSKNAAARSAKKAAEAADPIQNKLIPRPQLAAKS